MPKLRLPKGSHRGGRWLALGVAATVIALPGVAHASGSEPVPGLDPGSLSLPGLPGQGSGTGVGDSGSTSQNNASTNADPLDPGPAAATSSDSPSPQQQIQSALEKAGVSAKCSDAVQNDLMQLQTDIPGSLQAIVAALTSAGGGNPPSPADLQKALQDLLSGKFPSAPTGTTSASDTSSGTPPDAIATDLQKLVTDFTTYCIPAPPTGLPTPTSSSAGSFPAGQQQQSQSTQPQTTEAPARPVSYPGYAATGGIATTPVRPASSDTVPLAVLGGIVLTSAATAAGVRSRVRRHGR